MEREHRFGPHRLIERVPSLRPFSHMMFTMSPLGTRRCYAVDLTSQQRCVPSGLRGRCWEVGNSL